MLNHQLLTMSFTDSTADLSTPLRRLAGTCRVPIGFEASAFGAPGPGSVSRAVRVSVEKGTWRDVLDALVAEDSAYTWQELSGVVNVSPREQADSLPNIVIKRFEA